MWNTVLLLMVLFAVAVFIAGHFYCCHTMPGKYSVGSMVCSSDSFLGCSDQFHWSTSHKWCQSSDHASHDRCETTEKFLFFPFYYTLIFNNFNNFNNFEEFTAYALLPTVLLDQQNAVSVLYPHTETKAICHNDSQAGPHPLRNSSKWYQACICLAAKATLNKRFSCTFTKDIQP